MLSARQRMQRGIYNGGQNVNYGFLSDNRKCIGCHACSTACKSENEVPLGVNRTWVKYVEKGAFPDTRRMFQVTRCNHCANPPCVRICPVTAMYQRADGIVEFDPEVCIGCKASQKIESAPRISPPQPQAAGAGGPLQFGGRVAEHMVQTAYNAQHSIPWHWPVPAYLTTKSIGSGAFMLLALAVGLNLGLVGGAFAAAALLLSLLFIGLTTALLVLDLEKPRMFVTIL